MFEIAALVAIVVGCAVVFGILAILGFVFKLAFKIVLIPLTLLGFLLKAVVLVVGLALAVALIPIGLVVLVAGLLVAIPLALFAGIAGIGSLVWA